MAYHTPVLADEVCEALTPVLEPAPASSDAPGAARAQVMVDATCGGGGHTAAIMQMVQPSRIVCFDRDEEALAHARTRFENAPCPIELVHAPFSQIGERLADLGIERVSAIVADLGVSSHQLDTPGRGFSFGADAPLDMRMDPSQGRTAAEVLAEIEANELTGVLRDYGEEPDARRIANAIVKCRPTSTGELAQIVSAAMSAAQRRAIGLRIHPATRTFQAIRMLVNQELGELENFLDVAPALLVAGGRLGVISFHSLEDRPVKQRFRALTRLPQPPRGVPLRADELPKADFREVPAFKGGRKASADEVANNPRSRSARLRVIERLPA